MPEKKGGKRFASHQVSMINQKQTKTKTKTQIVNQNKSHLPFNNLIFVLDPLRANASYMACEAITFSVT